MAATSASALILSPACLARPATVSSLVVGRPPKVTPVRVAGRLVARGGLVGVVGLAGLVAARPVPDGLAIVWSTGFAAAGVRSSRPAWRSLASWSAFTCRASSSKGFGLALVAVEAASRPFLASRRPDTGWVPDLPAAFLGALAGVAVVGVGRGLAMVATPMPAPGAGCRPAIAVGDHEQPTTRPGCPPSTSKVSPSGCQREHAGAARPGRQGDARRSGGGISHGRTPANEAHAHHPLRGMAARRTGGSADQLGPATSPDKVSPVVSVVAWGVLPGVST
jgi:hypothetical protein